MLRIIAGDIKRKFQLWLHIWQYRRNNKHNSTTPSNLFRIEKVKVGNHTYGFINVIDHSNSTSILHIGNFCSIAHDVKFALGGDHDSTNISTFPFKAKFGLTEYEAIDNGSIILKDDVWVGSNCIILSGVTVNQGAILAAGSVVTNDVPAYAVAGGNPAKVIKYRHKPEIIKEMTKIDYSMITKQEIINNIDLWYNGAKTENITSIISKK